MTVWEFIKKLETFDKDLNIVITGWDFDNEIEECEIQKSEYEINVYINSFWYYD